MKAKKTTSKSGGESGKVVRRVVQGRPVLGSFQGTTLPQADNPRKAMAKRRRAATEVTSKDAQFTAAELTKAFKNGAKKAQQQAVENGLPYCVLVDGVAVKKGGK